MASFYNRIAVASQDRLDFLNYGYLPQAQSPAGTLQVGGTSSDYHVGLYHHACRVADFKGKDVIDVGSGLGGGAHYIARCLDPSSVIGFDISKKSVEMSNARFSRSNLEYRVGNAEALPIPDGCCDVVVCVESLCHYSSPYRFFREVARLLRNGGWFLCADYFSGQRLRDAQECLDSSSLRLNNWSDITADVVRAIEADNAKREYIVSQLAGGRLSVDILRQWARLVGTDKFHRLKSGKDAYVSFAYRQTSQRR